MLHHVTPVTSNHVSDILNIIALIIGIIIIIIKMVVLVIIIMITIMEIIVLIIIFMIKIMEIIVLTLFRLGLCQVAQHILNGWYLSLR